MSLALIPLAHAGHWLLSLPIYLGPVILLIVALKLADRRDRRRGESK